MQELAENLAVLTEFEELVRYCPMLAADPETVRELDRYTLQVLTSTARNNCASRRELQRQGIAQAKAQGVRFGRPKAHVPENFAHIVEAWRDGKITRAEAVRQSGLSPATFYRYLKELREKG